MSEVRDQRTEDSDQVRQSREKFFTLRREGAKEAFKSKSPVSSLDLSGFAPLRETSPIPWQR
jgi:hypothetical protein